SQPTLLSFNMSIQISDHIIYFFFFWLSQPPSSPLFPYTTLFRSVLAQTVDHFTEDTVGFTLVHFIRPNLIDEVINHVAKVKPTVDRKSTRLNSSHVAISYAVFCLKKKKKQKIKKFTK